MCPCYPALGSTWMSARFVSGDQLTISAMLTGTWPAGLFLAGVRAGAEPTTNPVEQGGVMFARSCIFLYGIAAYVVFLAAFLYAIGFVGNLLVPKSIDTGSAGSTVQAFIVDAILLGIFAIQHSVMARP